MITQESDAYSKLENVIVLRISIIDSNTGMNLSRGNTTLTKTKGPYLKAR
jgi:hypothetical protein